MSKYGHFSDSGNEYIITDHSPPRAQMNYMWNSNILSGVNQFGGGDGAYGDKAAMYIDAEGKGRATLIRNGNRYFYIRDEEAGELWNPGWYPSKKELDFYECRHGLGYSIIKGKYKGVEASVRIFVNRDDAVEICTIALKNTTHKEKKIKVYSFVEFSLEGYAANSEYDSYVSCEFDKKRSMIIAHNAAQERPHDWYDGFAASSLPVTGFDSSKRAFLGVYGDITAPESALRGKCSNTLAACELMVGALENTLTLMPDEEISYHVLFGSTNSTARAAKTVDKLFGGNKIEDDFNELLKIKEQMSEHITVRTPVDKINSLTNIWLKQQIQLCAELGRSNCKGFRDQLQDAWGIASFNGRLAREKILETLRYQYSDGRCARAWMPLRPHIYSDGPVWVAPTINAYLKETGDYEFLDIEVPYLDGKMATVWEHILLAARFPSDDLGAHGLTLAHDGDWNDSLNGIGIGGKGESVWTSIALCSALENTAEIAREIKKDAAIEKEMLERRERMKKAINETAWDGEWYLAAYNDLGQKVGTHTEREGRIYLNSQTWAILAGVCEGERLQACVNSIDKHLSSPYGPLTLYPPYTSYNPSIGRLTGFVPGIWENGTPYCHGGTFKIAADCHIGRSDEALEELLKIMPDSELNPSDHSGCEPYAFTNMYFGPDNPRAGETAYAWVTGTAGWVYRAITQNMLGFYPGYDIITIKPCLPSAWRECSIRRIYRGDVYNVRIANEKGDSTADPVITVDGVPIEGNSFKIFGDGKEHEIEVSLHAKKGELI